MNGKEIIKSLKSNKYLQINTKVSTWLLAYENQLPLNFDSIFGNAVLLKLSGGEYRDSHKFEKMTPNGIRALINHVKKADFNVNNPNLIEDDELTCEYLSEEDIINDLSIDKICENIDSQYIGELEGIGMFAEEYLDKGQKFEDLTEEEKDELFTGEALKVKNNYLSEIEKYKNILSEEKYKILKDFIKNL